MNTQAPTKRHKTKGGTLLVHSIFHTLQGEGPFTGVPAVFIRLGGCNLQCPGCDTEYSEGIALMTIEEIFAKITEVVNGAKTDLVVITGGEPFRQNLSVLVDQLHNNHIRVQIETNGSMKPQAPFEMKPVIICSPKTSKLNPEMEPLIDAYKYVVDYLDVNVLDGLPTRALGHRATPQLARPPKEFKGSIYIQPMDMTEVYSTLLAECSECTSLDKKIEGQVMLNKHNEANTKWCVESAMRNGYTVQLQIHKLLNLE